MDKNNIKKTGKKIAAALVLCLLTAGAFKLFSLFNILRMMTAEPSELPASSQEAENEEETVIISDTEIEQLLRGEITLDSLAQTGVDEEIGIEEPAGSEVPDDESAASGQPAKEEPSASSKAEQPSASSRPESSAAASTSQNTAAASSEAPAGEKPQEPAYEAEVRALVQQVYALKAVAEKGLDSSIEAAKSEYWALPEEQQTKTKKIMICLSKTGELTSLQSYCDKEMDRIVAQLRTVLKENGQSTELADQVMSTYKAEKSRRYAELKNKLYNG